MNGVKESNIVRKRRKQRSPVRSVQVDNLMGSKGSLDESSDILFDPSNGFTNESEEVYHSPVVAEKISDSLVAVMVSEDEFVANEHIDISNRETNPNPTSHTNVKHTDSPYIEIVPIPTGIHMNQICDDNTGTNAGKSSNSLTCQTPEEDSPGYGALLGQEARKKRTISALMCRICGAFLKRSVWQRERNFYSLKCRDILQSLERAVGEAVEKKEGASYGCKGCFEKLMRLRSVDNQLSKLMHEKNAIVEGIRKSFIEGQGLLSAHSWNGKTSTDYFLDEICGAEEVKLKQKKNKRMGQSNIIAENSGDRSDIKIEKSVGDGSSVSPEKSTASNSTEMEDGHSKSLVNQSASEMMQMLIAKHYEDEKVQRSQRATSSEPQNDVGRSRCNKDGERNSRENGQVDSTELLMQSRSGDVYESDTVDESCTDDPEDKNWEENPMSCSAKKLKRANSHQIQAIRKGLKLRGCFVDSSGSQQEAVGAVRALQGIQNGGTPSHLSKSAKKSSASNTARIENQVSSTGVTEYKIAKVNMNEDTFEENSLRLTIKQEPTESQSDENSDTLKKVCTTKITQKDKSSGDLVIKIPKVALARVGDLDKGYSKTLGLYVCEICGKKYPSKSGYRYHVKIHSGDRPFTCKYCQKSFVEAHILKQHERIHTGVKPYKCRWCDACFAQHSQIRVHERRHTKERPYKCDQCDKSFACNASLKAHRNSHQNKRPYVCEVCGKSYLWPNHLRSHMKYHGEPNYQCTHCGKKFISPSELKNHERSHTGERPYICHLCGKGFTQACHLGYHKKFTHANEEQKESLRCIYCHRKCRNYQGTKNHERICKEKSRRLSDSSLASLDAEEIVYDLYGNMMPMKEEPNSGVEDEVEEGLE